MRWIQGLTLGREGAYQYTILQFFSERLHEIEIILVRGRLSDPPLDKTTTLKTLINSIARPHIWNLGYNVSHKKV